MIAVSLERLVAQLCKQKHSLVVILFLTFFFSVSAHAQSTSSPLPNPYQPAIERWGTLPAGRSWGGIGGLDIDSKGHIWVFERCGDDSCAGSTADPILEFDTSGKLLNSFGGGMFVFPHALVIDKNDNIWVTDADAKDGKGRQVMEFSPKGEVLMKLGKPGDGTEGQDTFMDPTGVAIAKNGDIFVSDGHTLKGNGRVVKFSKDGKFIKTWGTAGSEPGNFHEPHSIAIDSQGRVFVADRGNLRIQIFDQDGKFIDQWKQFGIATGIFIDKKDTLYIAENRKNADWGRGIRVGSAKDGTVTAYLPGEDDPTKPGGSEYIVADDKGTIYGGEVQRLMIKKYVKK
jgi:DNA-binding beta-propeller fold protein YncE